MNHRTVFRRANPMPPWTCEFCADPIDVHSLFVHHRDENPTNNELSNLAPTHPACHVRYHRQRDWALERGIGDPVINAAAIKKSHQVQQTNGSGFYDSRLQQELGIRGGQSLASKRRSDSKLDAQLRAISRKNAARRCECSCGRRMNPGALGGHLRKHPTHVAK